MAVRPAEPGVAGEPHLVLADVGDVRPEVVGQLADALHHVVRGEHAALGAPGAVPGAGQRLLAPGRELREVRLADGGVDGVAEAGEAREDALRVAHDRDLDRHVLADLGGVDVRVDDPGVRRVRLDRAGDPVVEPHPDRDQQVRRLDRAVHVLPAVHAHVAVGERVLLVHRPDAQQRPGDRDLGLLGERLELVPGLGDQDPVTGEDQRALGLGDLLGGGLELLGVALEGGPEARQAGDDVVEGGVLGAGLGLQGVLGEVDVDRAGAAGLREVEGLGDDPRDVVGVPDQVVVLGHRQRDAGDVDLLERVLADQRAGHVAGQRDHRDRVQLGGADRRHEVRRARAAGAHAHADLAARPGVAVGRVAAALLVADEDVPDLGVVAEDVVDREDDAARVAEQRVGALEDQGLHQRVGADPGPLAVADLVEHGAARGLDRGGLRRAVARHVAPALRRRAEAAVPGLAAGSPFVIVISASGPSPRRSRDLPDMQKTLATRRGSLRCFGGRSPQWRPSLRVPPFSRREPVMRRPRRLSRPARSERRSARGVTSWGSRSRRGTVTRRPSAVTTTATRLRLRPWKKSKRPDSCGPSAATGSRSVAAGRRSDATTEPQPFVAGASPEVREAVPADAGGVRLSHPDGSPPLRPAGRTSGHRLRSIAAGAAQARTMT